MVGFKVFLQRFDRFLFFFPLLNLGKVGFFEMVFCFCGVCGVLRGNLY